MKKADKFWLVFVCCCNGLIWLAFSGLLLGVWTPDLEDSLVWGRFFFLVLCGWCITAAGSMRLRSHNGKDDSHTPSSLRMAETAALVLFVAGSWGFWQLQSFRTLDETLFPLMAFSFCLSLDFLLQLFLFCVKMKKTDFRMTDE